MKTLVLHGTHRLALAMVVLAPSLGWGHAGLVSSEPGRRAVVSEAPGRIKLCFNENVEPKFSAISLARADGAAVELAPPGADPDDARCLLAAVKGPMAAGSYSVKYKVLSVDGHIVEYGFGFSVKP